MKDNSGASKQLPRKGHAMDLDRRGFLSGAAAVGAAVVAAGGLVTEQLRAEVPLIQVASAWGDTPKVLTVWCFTAAFPRLLSGGILTWSGTGTFRPAGPAQCFATFSAPGPNTVQVTIKKNSLVRSGTLNVIAKDAGLYARVGSKVECLADAHGCPSCPHHVSGAFTEGAADLLIAGLPAVHVGHKGVHAACCGPNTFELAEGDPEVLYHGKALGVIGSVTRHCGGMGRIVRI